MTFLPSLPGDSSLPRVLQAYPETATPLLGLQDALMRGPSAFTVAERELIAAYVSGVNACTYCHGVHAATAVAFGVDPDLLAAILSDVDDAPVDPALRPVLRYVAKLTTSPARMTESDATEVFAAGWDERALHDAVLVCALFNFMNRMVDGLGVRTDPGCFAESGDHLHRFGYAGLLTVSHGQRARQEMPAEVAAPEDGDVEVVRTEETRTR